MLKARMLTLLALVAGCASRDVPGAANVLRLGSPSATLGQLGYFGAIAELPDGRIVIPQYDGPVLLANLDDGTVDSLGRNGDGPGEYRNPTLGLVRHGHPGVLDPMQHRITFWNPDGTLDTAVSILDIVSFELRVDTLGNLYAEQLPSAGFTMVGQEIDSTSPKDSTWIYRMHPPESGRDTVARLHDIGWEVLRLKGGGMSRMRRLYESQDQWGVLPDGSIWILRGQQNRVDRRSPEGAWTSGAPRAWMPIKATEADRQMLTGRFIAPGDTIYRPMADTKGPFQNGAVAAPDGEVWAKLSTEAGDSVSRFELFPLSGPSTRTVVVPGDRQVVAVTAKWVYTVGEDEDGFRVLERFARRLGG